MLRSSTYAPGLSGSQSNQAIALTTTMVHTGVPQGMYSLACCMAHAWGLPFPDMLIALPLRCYLQLSPQ